MWLQNNENLIFLSIIEADKLSTSFFFQTENCRRYVYFLNIRAKLSVLERPRIAHNSEKMKK